MLTKILSLTAVILTGIFSGWIFVGAQTWQISGSPPPDNSTIRGVLDEGGDNLGNVDPHFAEQTLNLNKHRILGVQATNETAFDLPQALGMGAKLIAGNNYSLDLSNNSASNATFFAQHSNGQAGLVVNAGIAVAVVDNAQVIDGIQFANEVGDLLSVNDTFSSGSVSDLYWGNRILCVAGETSCGYLSVNGVGDGLGNHIAEQALDMSLFRIYGVGSTSAAASLLASSTDQAFTARFQASGNHGVYSSSVSSIGGAGIYAVAEGDSYAVVASSTDGLAAKFTGDLGLYRDTSAAVDPAIQFNSDNGDRLSTTAGSPATTDLYWGNKILCDISESTCATGNSVVLPSLWFDNANGIHFPNSGTNIVNIGYEHDEDELFVGHYFDSSDGSYVLSTYTNGSLGDLNDVVVVNRTAYVAMGDGLLILDVSNLNNVKYISHVDFPAGHEAQGIEVSLPYAYLATTEGVYAVDVSDKTNPTVTDLYSWGASADPGWNNQYWVSLKLVGQYIYFINNSTVIGSRLLVLDVSDPYNISLVSTTLLGNNEPTDIDIEDDRAVITYWNENNNNGLVELFNVADPANPQSLDTITSGAAKPAKAVDIIGKNAYVVADDIRRYSFVLDSLVEEQGSADVDFYNLTSVPRFGGIIATPSYVYAVGSGPNGADLPIYYIDDPTIDFPKATSGNQYFSNTNSQLRRFTFSGNTSFIPFDDNSSEAFEFAAVSMQGLVGYAADASLLSSTQLSINNNAYTNASTFDGLSVGQGGIRLDSFIRINRGYLQIGGQTLTKADLDGLKAK